MKTIGLFITCFLMIMGGSAGAGYSLQEKDEKPTESPAEKDSSDQEINRMTNARMLALIKRLDPNPTGQMGNWRVKVEGHIVQIITDEKADRMRMITGIAKTDDMTKDQLYRIMQANFESALDARYAIAQDVVWGTFLHPLSSLSEDEFFSGLGQTLNLVQTYGTTFSSGVFVFGGGDSQNKGNVFDKVVKKGRAI